MKRFIEVDVVLRGLIEPSQGEGLAIWEVLAAAGGRSKPVGQSQGADMTLTGLRLFGSFAWPPLPGKATGRKKGVVELHFLPRPADKGGGYAACIRWVSSTQLGGKVSIPFSGTYNTVDPLPSTLTGVDDKTYAYRLDELPNSPALRLEFRGAMLLDLFLLDASGVFPGTEGNPRPDFRLPLTAEFEFNKLTQESGLLLFGNGRVELDLGIPLPVPRIEDDSTGANAAVFPVTATYWLREWTNRPFAFVPGAPLLLGRLQVWYVNPSDARIRKTTLSLGSVGQHLGHFTITADTHSGSVKLPRSNVLKEEWFWPTSAEFVDTHMLPQIGLDGGAKFGQAFAVDASSVYVRHQLRFERPNYGVSVVYRVALEAKATYQDGDFRSDVNQVDIRYHTAGHDWLSLRNRQFAVELENTFTYVAGNLSMLLFGAGTGQGFDWHTAGRITWSDRITRTAPSTVGDATDINELFAEARETASRARLGLQLARPTQPQSILPTLVLEEDSMVVHLGLFSTSRKARFDPQAGFLAATSGKSPVRGNPSERFRVSIIDSSPYAPVDAAPKWPKWGKLAVQVYLPSLESADIGAASALSNDHANFAAWLVHDPASYGADHGSPAVMFRVVPVEPPGEAPAAAADSDALRLGDLLLTLPIRQHILKDEGSDNDYSFIRFGGRPDLVDLEARKSSVFNVRVSSTTLDQRWRLGVTAVRPFGIDLDLSRNRRRSEPLIIDVSPKANGDSPFALDARERVSLDQNWWLTANLIDVVGANTPSERRFVVIDDAPFSVMQVHAKSLGGRSDLNSAIVATYDSDEGSWRLKPVSPLYHYSLPSQGVGESMDKPRRLEIHDAETVTDGPAMEDGGLRRRAVEHQLTPSAEIWVDPSDQEDEFIPPEWSVRALFGRADDERPGVILSALRAEFLYGLPVGVDGRARKFPLQPFRVAELGALLGNIRVEQRDSSGNEAIIARWNRLTRAIERRPQRLELLEHDRGEGNKLVPANFERESRFGFRHSALLRPPVFDPEETGQLVEDAQEIEHGPMLHRHGLSGGPLWGIESQNILNAFLNSAQPTGGFVRNVALGPHGGDADQQVEFNRGFIKVISQTKQGRVQSLKVEVLGRISTSWHRAKHVVVYERTTSPSAQFAPLIETVNDEKEQKNRSKRPILRKVREYVELMEMVRHYPDFPADALTTGPFCAIHFPARTINVDSAWSKDVGDDLWVIPLWNLYAANVRPQMYPRPLVQCEMAAEGPETRSTGTQESRHPQFLSFVVDTASAQKSTDTDTWPARIGIDGVDLRAPEASTKVPDIASRDETEQNVSRVPPGHRRFTWYLAPAAQRTSVNAARSGEPVYSALETVTFMRTGRYLEPAAGNQLDTAIAKLNSKINVGLASYWPGGASGGSVAEAGKGTALEEVLKAFAALAEETDIETAKTKAAELKAALADPSSADAKLSPALLGALGNWSSAKAVQVKEALDQPLTPVSGAATSVKAILSSAASECEKLKGDLIGGIRRKKLMVIDQIDSVARALAYVASASSGAITKDEVKAHVIDEVATALKPLFQKDSIDIADVRSDVLALRTIVDEVFGEFDSEIERGLGRLKAALTSYERGKPWSAARLQTFEASVFAIPRRAYGNIKAGVDEAEQRISVEVGALLQNAGGVVQAALRHLDTALSDLQTDIDVNGKRVYAILRQFASDATGQAAPAGQLESTLGRVRAFGVKHPGTIEAISKKIDDVGQSVRQRLNDASWLLSEIETNATSFADAVVSDVESLKQGIGQAQEDLGTALDQVKADIDAASGGIAQDVKDELDLLFAETNGVIGAALEPLLDLVTDVGEWVDAGVVWTSRKLERAARQLRELNREVRGQVDSFSASATQLVDDAAEAMQPDGLINDIIIDRLLSPALDKILAPIPDPPFPGAIGPELDKQVRHVNEQLRALADEVERTFDLLTEDMLPKAVRDVCDGVSGGLTSIVEDVEATINGWVDDAQKTLATTLGPALDTIIAGAATVDQLLEQINLIKNDLREITNGLSAAEHQAKAYGERVMSAVGNLSSGGLMAAPNNILKLYAAIGSVPEMPGLDFDRDRIGYYYDELKSIVDTTQVEAWFGKLGDELKALGLSLPFNKIGDRLLPDDLSKFDISRIFKNFGGMKLDHLFKGYKLPAGAANAIKISHAFDKKALRAWVQIDVKLPMRERKSLFSIGPFSLDFVDSDFFAEVRLEASKDTDRVETTGRAALTTNIEAVVAGEAMVSLNKVVVNYAKTSGLKVDFDPKGIELNRVFRFVQDTLGSIFGDEVGGLKIIKQGGIPIGVSHDFAMPPISLMAVTSGVSNISISNEFQLLAYPDFVIGDRFHLSRPDLPFIFSIFIIGGTGYVTVETQYRPFTNQLMVSVEAAAGGSASLGFAFAGVTGQVLITVSVALTYRKVIGAPGGGLTISLVVLIAGNVDVLGIVQVYIGVMLRLSYQDNGVIIADGSLSLSIRITRFFKIKVRAAVTYRMKGGKTQKTASSTSTSVETEEKIKKAAATADKLLKSQS